MLFWSFTSCATHCPIGQPTLSSIRPDSLLPTSGLFTLTVCDQVFQGSRGANVNSDSKSLEQSQLTNKIIWCAKYKKSPLKYNHHIAWGYRLLLTLRVKKSFGNIHTPWCNESGLGRGESKGQDIHTPPTHARPLPSYARIYIIRITLIERTTEAQYY